MTDAAHPVPPPAAQAEPAPSAEMQAYEALCARLNGFNPDLDAERLDGYFTALLAGRRTVLPSEWIPKLIGEDFGRVFADPQDVEQAMQVLMARWNEIAAALDPDALLDHPDELRLRPWMAVWDDAARAELKAEQPELPNDEIRLLQTGALWASGFFDALEDFADDWPDPEPGAADAEIFETLIGDIGRLLLDPESEEYRSAVRDLLGADETRPLTRDDVIDVAMFAVQELRLYWLEHAAKPAPRRVGPVPGRNDPCPCGSGRKYKKCHGAA